MLNVWKAYMGRMVFKKIASMLYDNSPCHVLPFEFVAREGQTS